MEPAAKRVRVHFGSFEEQEKRRLEQNGSGGRENSAVSAAVRAGIKAGNINIDSECALIGMQTSSLIIILAPPLVIAI